MPRKESKAVPEGNSPVPQQEEFGFGQPTLADVYRRFEERLDRQLKLMKSRFDQQERELDEFMEMMRETKQRLAGLEQDTQQPRFAIEADVQADTKTLERTEGAAKAVQEMHEDSCSANRVDPDPMCSTSFGDDCTGPPALPCSRDDALVSNGAAAPTSFLSPLEMYSPIAAGGLLPTGKTSTATKTTLHQLPLWFYLTEETNLKTSILYISYFSSFEWINNQQAPFWPRVIEIKSGQNRMFDPDGSKGRLHACPFWGAWRALLCVKVLFLKRLMVICNVFCGDFCRSGTRESFTPYL